MKLKGVCELKRPKARTLPIISVALLAASWLSHAQVIPGQYIAVLKRGTQNSQAVAETLGRQHGLGVGAVYGHAIQGFAFRGSPKAAAALTKHAQIAYVEPDQLCWPSAEGPPQVLPTGVDRVDVDAILIDDVPLINGIDDVVDADVAIIDSGIDIDHPDLRVVGGKHFYWGSRPWKMRSDDDYDDVWFHGTFVAGIAGAIDNEVGVVGVAPGVRLWAVRVFEEPWSSTPKSVVIAALDWVTANSDIFEVANLSLGGGYSQAENDAVRRAVEAGIVVTVAAGNSSADAADYSPASEPTALTVSAMEDINGLPGGGVGSAGSGDDNFAYFSNFGEIVDVCAPGCVMVSTFPDGEYGRFGSGTSWAAPHVAGAAALYIAAFGMDKSFDGVFEVSHAIKTLGWQLGELEYILEGDPDEFPEPLLNVARLMTELPPPLGMMHVADLHGESISLRRKWTATVTVFVHDSDDLRW